MKRKLASLLVLSLFLFSQLSSQEKNNVKFGNVSESDFSRKIYAIDSNATAVVIADIGFSTIEGNSKGWFSLVFKHFKRVHILNKNGYDAANVSIPLYADGNAEEELNKLKAVTYNLENGKVVETKLDVKSNVFKDKINKNRVIKKFTFPNVKEGSIIEFEYAVTSDFLHNLQPWSFQGGYPRLWSEYNLRLPEFFYYVFLSQGYLKYDINDRKQGHTSYAVSNSEGVGPTERIKLESAYTDYRWVIKNIPALKEEAYTSTVDNYTAKIEFQLSEYRYPLQYRNVMGSWSQLSTDLMKAEYFGQPITRDNGWLKDITRPLMQGTTSKIEKARKIFNWVRENITCTAHNDVYLNQTLRNVVKNRNGSVSEVNLLLAAMLRNEDIDTDPVLLSTRNNGVIYPLYPLMSRFNYVVCRIQLDGKHYLLDASEPRLGFGYLPLRCYNGQARIIDGIGTPMELSTDNLLEKKITSVFVINGDNGKLLGRMQKTPGYYESFSLRNQIKENKEEFIKGIEKGFGMPVEISNSRFDSLDIYDEVMNITYDFDMAQGEDDIIYVNPMFGEGYKDNPFKSAERFYPVEMPYTMDEVYNLQIEIPKGYVVDELPKQIMVKLNEESDVVFEYRISQSANHIALRSRLIFKRSNFNPEEYENLREFFNLIVKKHNEQIVFKKKK